MKKRRKLRYLLLTICSVLWLAAGDAARAEEETEKVEETEKEEEHPGTEEKPELKELQIRGREAGVFPTAAGKAMLYEACEGADVQLTFCIKKEENWNPQELKLELVEREGGRKVWEGTGEDSEINWEEMEEPFLHAGVLEFDGEPDRDGVYQLKLSYGESWESQPFILDHRAPRIRVERTKPVRILDGAGADLEESASPTKDCTAYYKDDIQVLLTIEEKYARPLWKDGILTGLTGLETRVNGETEALRWEQTGEDTFQGSMTLSAEQAWRFQSAFRDAAGNRAETEDEETRACLEEGNYESPGLVIDRTGPRVSLSRNREPEAEYQGRSYFAEAVTLSLEVFDENLRLGELRAALSRLRAEDSEGKAVTETSLSGVLKEWNPGEILTGSRTFLLPVSTEANYRIPLGFTDLAGNPAVWAESGKEIGSYALCLTVDEEAPELPEFQAVPGIFVPCAPGGWLFSASPVELTVSGRDRTAGIRRLRCTVTDEEGKSSIREQTLEPSATGSLTWVFPAEEMGADFKGTLKAEVWDWTGRRSEKLLNCGIESEAMHQKAAENQLMIRTAPGRVVDGQAYYNTDVELELQAADSFSGLRDWTIRADGRVRSRQTYNPEASDAEAYGETLVYRAAETLSLAAADYNHNGVRVESEFTDQAGHKSRSEVNLSIDVTKPVVTVAYEENQPVHGNYYRQPRTAVVTIRERNFDERDVKFRITGPEGAAPVVSGWTHSGSGEEAIHTCRLIFDKDGAYAFGVEFQDLAGNQADYDRTDRFVIDCTAPELTVTWDNREARNGFYYKEKRTARLELREEHFDPEEFDIRVETEEAAGGKPQISGWSSRGAVHTAYVHFTEDGAYQFAVTGRDLAGNELSRWESERFVVDQTPPELEISGVRNHSANNGEVRPEIRSADAHYDPAGETISLKGRKNGAVKLSGSLSRSGDGMEYRLEDIPGDSEWDDLYTLQAAVTDLAGNRSEETVLFSVNRYGSVYTLDEATERLAGEGGSYYTREAPEPVIIETNVDTLTFRELICSRNGESEILMEGKDYRVTKSGEEGWQQYTWRIGKDNFREDGVYALTLYSEDRACNASDNQSKGKRLEFAVDRTSPVILVSGIEENGRYREAERTVLLDVEDNLGLREVRVRQNGELRILEGDELRRTEGRLQLSLTASDDWQELSVEAVDLAGNRAEGKTIRFLLTPSRRVLFWQNRKQREELLPGLTILATGGIITTVFLCRQKSRKNAKQKSENKD